MTQSYIGRGELRVKKVLQKLYPSFRIEQQIPLSKLIEKTDFDILDEVYQKHKFDLAIAFNSFQYYAVIEVNYKHGEVASRKWSNIFKPLLEKVNIKTVTINDYECTSVFDTKEERSLSWKDFIDVINGLSMGGLEP